MGENDGMHIESDDAMEADGSGVTHANADAGEGSVQDGTEAACERHDDGKDATDSGDGDTVLSSDTAVDGADVSDVDATIADDGIAADESAGSSDADANGAGTTSEDNDETMGNPADSDTTDDTMEGAASVTEVTDSDDGTAAAPNGDEGIDAEHDRSADEPHDDGSDADDNAELADDDADAESAESDAEGTEPESDEDAADTGIEDTEPEPDESTTDTENAEPDESTDSTDADAAEEGNEPDDVTDKATIASDNNADSDSAGEDVAHDETDSDADDHEPPAPADEPEDAEPSSDSDSALPDGTEEGNEPDNAEHAEAENDAVAASEETPDEGAETPADVITATEEMPKPLKDHAESDEQGGTKSGKHRLSKKRKRIAIACGIAAAAVIAGCLYVGSVTADALEQVSADASQASLIDSTMSGLLDRTAPFSDLTDDNVMPDDGGDGGVLATFASARDSASAALSEETPSANGIAWYDMDGAKELRTQADSIVQDKTQAYHELHSAASAVTVSKYDREKQDAKDALQASSNSAQGVLDSTENEVHDNAIRQTLADAIDAGNALLGNDTLLSAGIYSSAQGKIDTASQAVSDDHAQWQKEKEEEEERQRQAAAAAAAAAAAERSYASKEAAESAAASSGGYAAQSSDGTWYVSYRGNDQEGTANSDGSVSEYRDGYYIAHRSGTNGQTIASKPSHVVVDGKSYHYVSSITVSDQSSLDDALAYARQNGGIGFQTCTIPTGGDIIVHYEPDN